MWLARVINDYLTVVIFNSEGRVIYEHVATEYEVKRVFAAVEWYNEVRLRAAMLDERMWTYGPNHRMAQVA